MTAINVPQKPRQTIIDNASGVITWTLDPGSAGTGGPLGLSTVYLVGVGLYAAEVVTNILLPINQGGAGGGCTLFKLGLYTKAGLLLKDSGNVSADAKLATSGVKSFALSGGAYTVPATDVYYLALIQVGQFVSPALNLLRGSGAAPMATGQTYPKYCGIGTAGGSSDLPAGPTAVGTAFSIAWWLGVS